MAIAYSHVHVKGVSLAASEARMAGVQEGCPEMVVQTRAIGLAWARLSMVELKIIGRTQEPLGVKSPRLEPGLWMGVSANELRGKTLGVWLASFQDIRESSEGLDFGQEELCAECVEYEAPLGSWVLEPGGELQLETGMRAASGTGRAQREALGGGVLKQLRGWVILRNRVWREEQRTGGSAFGGLGNVGKKRLRRKVQSGKGKRGIPRECRDKSFQKDRVAPGQGQGRQVFRGVEG